MIKPEELVCDFCDGRAQLRFGTCTAYYDKSIVRIHDRPYYRCLNCHKMFMTETDSIDFTSAVRKAAHESLDRNTDDNNLEKQTAIETSCCVCSMGGLYWHIQQLGDDDVYLALCEDNIDDPPFVYTLYIVNRSGQESTAKMQTYAFTSDDDDLIQTDTCNKNFILPAKGFVKIENDDPGTFEFVTNFYFDLTDEDGRKRDSLSFSIPKYLSGLKKCNLPGLNKQGYVIFRSVIDFETSK